MVCTIVLVQHPPGSRGGDILPGINKESRKSGTPGTNKKL